ncbi:MAG: antibiotic biosynthesis monooxygenase [Candidatus Micrarchaeota archaeon]
MGMVMSILEGDLPPDKAARLEANFAEGAKALEPGMLQTFFIKNGNKCRIITIWESKDAYTSMKSKGIPKGVLMFRYAGVEASLLVYDVVNSASRGK